MQGKVVLITGVARGIGKSVAEAVAKLGGIVVGFDILENELQLLEAHLKNTKTTHLLEKVDITQKEACSFFVEKVVQKFNRIDMVIHSAGITHIAPCTETSLEAFDRLIQINLLGTIYITQLCLPKVIENKGCIVGISSVAGYSPLYYRTAYAASKYGVWGYLETLHGEMKEKQVHVMTVCPSFVETKLQENQQKYFTNNTNEALTTEYVAHEILKGIEAKNKQLFIGKTAKMAYWVHKFFPNFYEKVMIKKTKLNS
jgi:short-subunit dehydrogenase